LSIGGPGFEDDYTFGLKIPIVDVFEDATAMKFELLKQILGEGADFIMRERYGDMCNGVQACLWFDLMRRFRWIHIPVNNIEWVEESLLFRTCIYENKQY
jgi:hypothetical protein